MIGLVAKFPLHNALNFAQMDGGIELFQVDDIARNGFRIDGVLRVPRLRPLISESRHALEDKTPRFVAHGRALHPGLPTALRSRFAVEDDRSDDLVIVLEWIDKVQPNLGKFLLSGHQQAPFRHAQGVIMSLELFV